MSSAVILGLVGGLLVVAFLANRVFGLTRIPDVLVLMMLGVLLGPGLGLVQAGTLAKTTNLLGTLAIILVLFEGGLELDLRDTIQHFPGQFSSGHSGLHFQHGTGRGHRGERPRPGLD